MNERHLSEVEKVLLYIGDARMRAKRAGAALAKDGADADGRRSARRRRARTRGVAPAACAGTYYATAPTPPSIGS
jgi:hypothetical protein